MPLLRFLCPSIPLLFYCHYPDKLLAERQEWWKKLYRLPFDWLEGWSTGNASVVVVNSKFTRSVVRRAFPALGKAEHELQVVYPCVDVESTSIAEGETASGVGSAPGKDAAGTGQEEGYKLWRDDRKLLLSINRFERTKNIGLAIRAFAALEKEKRSKARLVLAGMINTPPMRMQANSVRRWV